MEDKSQQEKSVLNDYHRKRNEEELLAVQEMLKHPLSPKEVREQAARLNSQSTKKKKP